MKERGIFLSFIVVIIAISLFSCKKDPDDPLEKFNDRVNKGVKSFTETIQELFEKKNPKGRVQEGSPEIVTGDMTGEDIIINRFFEKADKAFLSFCGDGDNCGYKEINQYCALIADKSEIKITSVDGLKSVSAKMWLPKKWIYNSNISVVNGPGISSELFDEIMLDNVFLPEPNFFMGGRSFTVSAGVGWRGTIVLGKEKTETKFKNTPPIELAVEGSLEMGRGVELYMKTKVQAKNIETQMFVNQLLCFMLSGIGENNGW